MKFCGWGSSSQCCKPSQLLPTFAQLMPNQHAYNNQKVSVKVPDLNQNSVRFCHPMPTFDTLNRTQLTYEGTNSTWEQGMLMTNSKEKSQRKNSIIDQVSDSNGREPPKLGYQQANCIRQTNMYRSAHERQRLRSEQPQFRPQVGEGSSYAQLLKQNQQLKRVIAEQFVPLKRMYQRLKQEQEDREYLVSQLEWKVRQLGRELKSRKL